MKNARDIAVDALTAFRKRQAWSDGFLRNEIRANELSGRDAALATELVNGVLQNMFLLDFYISKFSSIRLNKISPGILDIIRLSVYQILFLDRIPDSAAVNDAVNRVKRSNKRAAGFVNAITRKISASKDCLPEITGSFSEVLSVKYSHPVWMVDELINIYGREETERILSSDNERSRTVIRINTLKTTYEKLCDFVSDENTQLEKGLVENSAYIRFSGALDKNEAFARGLFHVQDSASQIAALTLAPKENTRVLDACAAPGGKSFLLAQLMKNTGKIISCDIHEHKLPLISDGAKRLGIDTITPRVCDASQFLPEFEEKFDYILADVPCSGLGIIRKKPDIRYKKQEDIIELPDIQFKILSNLSRYLKKGGTLLYSTCTILPRENNEVIARFLKNNGEFYEEKEYMDIPCKSNDFGITLLPHISNTDGFYICKLRRKK